MRTFTISSSIPEICKTENCFLGIDEAGRGPVLGPMVYAVLFAPIIKNTELTSLKFNDSKLIKEDKREKLFKLIKITEYIGWAATVISPLDISAKMLQKDKVSLNSLAFDATVELIKHTLSKDVSLKTVYVDTLGPPGTHQEKLSKVATL
ncbi:ribonuclease H2 subunit A-like [Zophobas morio]|uniref:ribonuclease H2 subunit A-like n=1 Tax=Zophobas morio TaxID=2755281 RepID=UPI00308360EE